MRKEDAVLLYLTTRVLNGVFEEQGRLVGKTSQMDCIYHSQQGRPSRPLDFNTSVEWPKGILHGLPAVGSFWMTSPHMAEHQRHSRVFKISHDLQTFQAEFVSRHQNDHESGPEQALPGETGLLLDPSGSKDHGKALSGSLILLKRITSICKIYGNPKELVPYWCHKRYALAINSSNSTRPHSSGVPNNLKANVTSVSQFEYCSPQPWSPCKLQKQQRIEGGKKDSDDFLDKGGLYLQSDEHQR
ncbi:hypothetical protein TURU_032106 [Turdus rufiventris]|nr:hypothetical protein TURU_032106 [Turdus rufiventris]